MEERQMILKAPFLISVRLLPALKIADGWLSFDPDTHLFYLDTPEFDYLIEDFRPGAGSTVQSCFEDILSFFEYAVDEYKYGERSEESMFPLRVTEWLVSHEYDISDTGCSIEEEGLIT